MLLSFFRPSLCVLQQLQWRTTVFQVAGRWEGRKEAERANEREMSEHDVLFMPKLPCLEQGRRSADTLSFFYRSRKLRKRKERFEDQLVLNRPYLHYYHDMWHCRTRATVHSRNGVHATLRTELTCCANSLRNNLTTSTKRFIILNINHPLL